MMRRPSSRTNGFWFATPIGLWFLLSAALPASLMAADMVIEHVNVISPERDQPLRNAMVRVHDGRIVAVAGDGKVGDAGRGTTVVDGTGLFLSPGLIDSHVHLTQIPGMTDAQEAAHPDIASAARRQFPHSYLLHGFTTLIDLVTTPEGVARWRQSSDAVPDTYWCGGAALMDGYSMNYEPKPQRYHDFPYMLMEPGMQAPPGIDPAMHTPQAVVSRMKSDGASCVKTFYETGFGGTTGLPVPKLETIRAVVKAAHALELPVLMHANSEEAQDFALRAGVDIIAHGLWNWKPQTPGSLEITPGVQQILDGVVAGKVGWQPTIQVIAGIQMLFDPAFLDDPRLARVVPAGLIDWYRSPEGGWFRESMAKDGGLPTGDRARVNRIIGRVTECAVRTSAYLIAHHGRILFGTDTPSGPIYTNPPGLNAELEMHHLIDAGETPAQIFRSATLLNAQALKLDGEIGTVEVGKRANLLLLRQDPTQTTEAYNDIAKVILNGRVLEPSALAANSQQ